MRCGSDGRLRFRPRLCGAVRACVRRVLCLPGLLVDHGIRCTLSVCFDGIMATVISVRLQGRRYVEHLVWVGDDVKQMWVDHGSDPQYGVGGRFLSCIMFLLVSSLADGSQLWKRSEFAVPSVLSVTMNAVTIAGRLSK